MNRFPRLSRSTRKPVLLAHTASSYASPSLALGVLLSTIYVVTVVFPSSKTLSFTSKHPWNVSCEHEDVSCFVETALAPWRSRHIFQVDVERAWRGKSQGEWCQLLQIINNQIFHFPSPFTPPKEAWRQKLFDARIEAIINITRLALSRHGGLPRDTEFVFCLGDCVASVDPFLPLPDFSVVKCEGSSAIPFPLFDVFRPPTDVSLAAWSHAIDDIKANRNLHSWARRHQRVIFRGEKRSCSPNASDDGHSSIPVNNMPWSDNCGRPFARALVRNDERFDFDPPPKVNMLQHEQYKYVMYIHGHCHWANRLRRLLFMGMALFKQVGLCDEYYALRLLPWVHYIPVDYNFKNLSKAVSWAMSHDQEVVAMVDRMHQYAERYNTADFAIDYTFELLVKYTHLLGYDVVRRPGRHRQMTLE